MKTMVILFCVLLIGLVYLLVWALCRISAEADKFIVRDREDDYHGQP